MPPVNTQGMNPSQNPLQAAIARRQGALNQQSAGSATPSPLPVPPPQGNPQMVHQTPMRPQTPPEPWNPEQTILEAMAGRLKSAEKIAEAKAIPPKYPTSPMGG